MISLGWRRFRTQNRGTSPCRRLQDPDSAMEVEELDKVVHDVPVQEQRPHEEGLPQDLGEVHTKSSDAEKFFDTSYSH